MEDKEAPNSAFTMSGHAHCVLCFLAEKSAEYG